MQRKSDGHHVSGRVSLAVFLLIILTTVRGILELRNDGAGVGPSRYLSAQEEVGLVYVPLVLSSYELEDSSRTAEPSETAELPQPTAISTSVATETIAPATSVPTEIPTSEPGPSGCPIDKFLEVQPSPFNEDLPDPWLDVSCEGDRMFVETNGIPSFEYRQVTRFPLREQDLRWEIPLVPEPLEEPVDLPLLGPVAITIDGLPIYGPNEADALGFGDPFLDGLLDFCNGHTGLQGGYHYHALAKCLWDELDMEGNTDLIVGYAFDGYPIKAPFKCADPDCTEVIELKSSWQRTRDVKAAWDAHEYIEGHGDLDRCNGRMDEDGQYQYYATRTFPYFLACFSAEAVPNSVRQGGGNRPPMP